MCAGHAECEPYGIYVGAPARLLRFRLRESAIADLLDTAWQDWPLDRRLRNKCFFSTDLATNNVN